MTLFAPHAAWRVSRPERAALAVVALAWLLFAGLQGLRLLRTSPAVAPADVAATPAGFDAGILTVVVSVVVMTAAMMGPLALPVARHVAQNSLRARRDEAVLLFLGSYLAVWTTFSLAMLAIVVVGGAAAVSRATGPWLVLLLLAVALGWQLSATKRRILRSCQRPVPLPARGRAATLGSIRFGVVFGGRCIASCWALMLLMLLPSTNHLLWLIVVTALLFLERSYPAIRRRPALLGPGIVAAGVPLALLSAWPPVVASYSWLCPIPIG